MVKRVDTIPEKWCSQNLLRRIESFRVVSHHEIQLTKRENRVPDVLLELVILAVPA